MESMEKMEKTDLIEKKINYQPRYYFNICV